MKTIIPGHRYPLTHIEGSAMNNVMLDVMRLEECSVMIKWEDAIEAINEKLKMESK